MRLHTIEGNAIVLKISKAALLAAVLSLSAAPGVGLIHAVAQDASSSAMDDASAMTDDSSAADDSSSSAEDSTDTYNPADFTTTVTIPSVVTATDSSMDENAIRDSLSGNFLAHAADFAKLTATSIAIPTITVTVANAKTSTTTTITVKDVLLANVKDGVAESAKIGSMTTVNDKANFAFGAFSTSTFNIAGLLKFYGVVEGDSAQPLQTLYKDLNFDGGTFTAPGVSCTFGKVSAAEFDARPLKVSFSQMMAAATQLGASKGNPPPEAVSTYVTFLLDVFSAYKSTPMTLDGLDCKGAEAGKAAEVSLGTVTIDGYQPGIYPAVTAKDLKVDAGAQGHFNAAQIVIKATDLSAPIAAVDAAKDQLSAQWFKDNYRHLIPAWGGMSLSGIDMDVPMPDDPSTHYLAKIASFDLSLSDYLNGIPTKVSSTGTGIDVPIPPSTDADSQMLTALGITRVNLNYEISAAWDKTTQTINVDKVNFSGNDLGGFAFATVLGNATEDLFATDSDTEMAAGMGLTIKSAKTSLMDAGLADKLWPLFAAQQGSHDPAAFRTQMAGVAEGAALQMLGSTDAARQLGAAIGDFISGKAKTVTINVTAKDPAGVPIPTLMAASENPTVLTSAVDITGSAQ